jgi:phospholipid/cholesterol/gamma-HCH transport system permease protein
MEAGATAHARRIGHGAALRAGRGYRALEYLAGLLALLTASMRALVRDPFGWQREAVDECWLILRRCPVPLVLSSFAFGFGTIGLQGGTILNLLGGLDRGGVFYSVAGPREFAPFLTGLVVAGVVGTALCADLGARKIREELDAMAVLGVDPVPQLVAPRLVAIVVMTPILSILAVASGLLAGLIVYPWLFHVPSAMVLSTFAIELKAVDIVLGCLLKCAIYGGLIATVCAYEGLNARGGAEGVGRAVNRAVVIAFVAIFVVNFALNAILLASFPELQQVR